MRNWRGAMRVSRLSSTSAQAATASPAAISEIGTELSIR